MAGIEQGNLCEICIGWSINHKKKGERERDRDTLDYVLKNGFRKEETLSTANQVSANCTPLGTLCDFLTKRSQKDESINWKNSKD
jgi:hypothetical protein